ncbi:hypothetical protein B484DRAFT_170803 [Ochromonadaceae sp. CCMP2298]|nr:hypothetical protein B484DRAFT_170803 [Ochromonadaceae sp. CCMP2298]
MMFWGGEYQRNVKMVQQSRFQNRGRPGVGVKISPSNAPPPLSPTLNLEEPILDFRVVAGAPLRSRCSWGRVAVRGSGPLKRILKSRDFLVNFLFDKWHRLYFSLDEFGLFMFDNKFNTSPLHCIGLRDLKDVSVDLGAPIRQNAADALKNVSEDIHNVKVSTFSGDVLYMRFPDMTTRISWQEALTNAIKSRGGDKQWLHRTVTENSSGHVRGLLASADMQDATPKADTKTAEEDGGKGEGGEDGGNEGRGEGEGRPRTDSTYSVSSTAWLSSLWGAR